MVLFSVIVTWGKFKYYLVLLRTTNLFDFFFLFLVFLPPVILPCLVFGRLVPRPCFPSPPPCGWSTGFLTVPLTFGLRPSHRLRPAFPRFIVLCSIFDTWPIEA